MAFDPFAGFAKYRRFWMGLTMILILITFVLCTGTKGDMQDILLRYIRWGGTPVAQIDGSTYYRHDFDKLQTQRKVANDYMRLYAKILIDSLNEQTRNLGEPKEENQKKLLVAYQQLRQVLTERTKSPKFFGSGTKGEELIDFQVWLKEADRLGISLTPAAVANMIDRELFKDKIFNFEREAQEWHVAPSFRDIELKAMNQVIRDHGGDRVNAEFIFNALMNEYRVRIAQLADAEYQVVSLFGNRTIKRINPTPHIKADLVRTPMSPGILYDYFKDNRHEFDVALLPLPLDQFAKDIPEPNEAKLKELFEKYKKTAYDPSSDTPGFQKPHQIKVQTITADMSGPFYKRIADVADTFAEYPIGSFVPQYPLATALTFAAGPSMFDSVLDQQYHIKLLTQARAKFDFAGGGHLMNDLALPAAAYLAKKDAQSIASMVAANARPDGVFASIPKFVAGPSLKEKDLLETVRKIEAKSTFPWFASAVGVAPASPFGAFWLVGAAAYDVHELPLMVVRPVILKEHQIALAKKHVMANMAFLKKRLEDNNVAGKASAIEREMKRWGPLKPGEVREKPYRDLGLEIAQTDKFYDKFNIKDAPELKPLLEAYAYYYSLVNQSEARDLRPETLLKDEDFWRLFFDSSEAFAVSGRYNARAWPPVVRLGSREQIEAMLNDAQLKRQTLPDLDYDDMRKQADARDPNRESTFSLFATSERPFLFWKTEEKTPEPAESLDAVRAQVVEAYKKLEARDSKVLPHAKKLALSLLAGNADYASVLRQEAVKSGQNMITLPELAPFHLTRTERGGRIYDTFKLPKGVIPYPREDTVNQLLKLIDLKEPIVVDVPEIDKLNKELFDDAVSKKLKGNKFVQVITNKARDNFYLAVVGTDHGATLNEFLGVLGGAALEQDTFFDRAQEKLGESHYREILRQLREDHRVTVYDEAKKYDTDPGN